MEDHLNQKQVEQMKRIKQLLAQQEWNRASEQLEKLYEQRNDNEINHLLVEALYMDNQFKMAYEFAVEKQETFLLSADLFKLMVNVLLKSQHLIEARQFALATANANWQAVAIQGINEFETTTAQTLVATRKANLRQFYHLGDQPFPQQRERLARAGQLPLADYMVGAKFLLRDPFTNPLIRSSILQNLQKLKITDRIKTYWIDEKEHEIDGAQLVPIDQIPGYQQLIQALKERLENVDPVAYATISQEIGMQMMMCYPFIEQVVTDADGWVDLEIAQFQGKTDLKGLDSGMAHWHSVSEALIEALIKAY